MAPSLAAQVDRKCASQRFVGKICVCDPAQADSVTECGSTWPIMAFVSHPRLVTTAPLLLEGNGTCVCAGGVSCSGDKSLWGAPAALV